VTAQTFLSTIIRPALEALDFWSEAAGQLLLGTALQESKLCYRRQIGGGPALGLFQMEPATHADCWSNYLVYRPELAHRVLVIGGLTEPPDAEWLVGHDEYSCAMARIKYLRCPAPLPPAGDISAIAEYWLKWYNGGGKGTVDAFLANWREAMGD
jgi:hypothetical protein